MVGPGRPPRTTTPPGKVGRGSVGDAGSGDTSSVGLNGEDNDVVADSSLLAMNMKSKELATFPRDVLQETVDESFARNC